ncbi:MAG: PD-(D/E)XK nuclease family protein, partial [Vicinamibacterales bacterium]
MKKLTSFVSAAGARRLLDARERVLAIEPPILIMAATRAAADEFALSLAAEKGATFGVTRSSVAELVSRLAVPALAKKGLTPTAPLSDEAVAARVADDLANRKALDYFTPVARMPGFPRALSRTLGDLRLADVAPDRLSGHTANDDLRALLERAIEERLKAGAVDYATLLHTATTELQANRQLLADKTVVLLDIAIASKAEEAFAKAVIEASKSAIATIPAGDVRTLESLGAKAPVAPVASASARAKDGELRRDEPAALARLQRYLFSPEPPPKGETDDSVVLFSAPGEGREAIEIARRVLQEAARGVHFDQMAVLLRAPQTYLGVLEHALERAGVPAWFHRGTRRPDPAGRALLALLACADEELSARRFAEYVSLGQVPLSAAADADLWSPPADEL